MGFPLDHIFFAEKVVGCSAVIGFSQEKVARLYRIENGTCVGCVGAPVQI
jgi:hypothetical protein